MKRLELITKTISYLKLVVLEISISSKRLDEVVNDIMKIGLEMIFKKYGIDGSVHQNYESASREISKIKNWSDIKGKL